MHSRGPVHFDLSPEVPAESAYQLGKRALIDLIAICSRDRNFSLTRGPI